jgi:hypothetical protein
MSKYSQKPTNNGKWVVAKAVSGAVQPKYGAWVVRSSETGRFTGMSKKTERVTPVIIPGYKTRG